MRTLRFAALFLMAGTLVFFIGAAPKKDNEISTWTTILTHPALTEAYTHQMSSGKLALELWTKGLEQQGETTSSNHLRRRTFSRARDIRARVRVKNIDYSLCGGGLIPPFARAAIGAFFLRTKEKGERVFSAIAVTKGPEDGLEVRAVMLTCKEDCFLRPEDAAPGDKARVVLLNENVGELKWGEEVDMRMRHVPEHNAIVFYKNTKPVAVYGYDPTTYEPSDKDYRQIDVGTFVPNCKKGRAGIAADFSDVTLK